MNDLRVRELRQMAARIYANLLNEILDYERRGEINEKSGEDIILLAEITKKATSDFSGWYLDYLK